MSSLSPLVQRIAARLKEELTAACGQRLVEARVFGSRARDFWEEGSDLDLFVMVDEHDEEIHRAVQRACWTVAAEFDWPFSIHPLTMEKSRFEDLLARERRIALDIAGEGVPI